MAGMTDRDKVAAYGETAAMDRAGLAGPPRSLAAISQAEPNLVDDPSLLEQAKIKREQGRERNQARRNEAEGIARATAQSDEDRTLAKETAMNRFSPSGRRVMSPAQAAAKSLRDMEAGKAAPSTSPSAGFQSTGMDGKPGFQLRSEEERQARIGASPVSPSSKALSSFASPSPTPAPAATAAPMAATLAPAPTVSPIRAMAADAQSFNMTNAGIAGPPKALANSGSPAPAPQAQPAAPVAMPPVTTSPSVSPPPSASPMPTTRSAKVAGTSAVSPNSPSQTVSSPVDSAVSSSPSKSTTGDQFWWRDYVDPAGIPTYSNLPPDPFTSPYSAAKVAGTTPEDAAKNFGSAGEPEKFDLSPLPLLKQAWKGYTGPTAKRFAKSLATGFAAMTNPSAAQSLAKPKSLSSMGPDESQKTRPPSGMTPARG